MQLSEKAGSDQDENFAFIAGYTSGGAPYGVTWEEWEALEPGESLTDAPPGKGEETEDPLPF